MPGARKSGMIVAATLLLAGGVTAGIAWWYNLSRTRQALAYWGPPGVALIRDAPRVTAYKIEFRQDAGAMADPRGTLLHPVTRVAATVIEARDISRAKGLVHLRHALLDDRSFAWSERPTDVDDVASVLTFEQGGARLAVYFSSDFTRMTVSGNEIRALRDGGELPTISTRPIAAGLREYFAGVFP